MAVTLVFENPINVSVQVGDIAYYCNSTNSSGGFDVSTQSSITTIGVITSIDHDTNTIVCGNSTLNTDTGPTGEVGDTPGDFILFSKDNRFNTGSLLGYYGLAKFINDSKDKGEMFAASCEVFESSK